MLEEVLHRINNYFCVRIESGRFSIVGGQLAYKTLLDGQYFRIKGSVLNDGIYQWPCTTLTDEDFYGEIWELSIPKAVIRLSNEIEEWMQKNPVSDKVSESFGGYSYNKGTGADGAPITWVQVFGSRLRDWRKL